MHREDNGVDLPVRMSESTLIDQLTQLIDIGGDFNVPTRFLFLVEQIWLIHRKVFGLFLFFSATIEKARSN